MQHHSNRSTGAVLRAMAPPWPAPAQGGEELVVLTRGIDACPTRMVDRAQTTATTNSGEGIGVLAPPLEARTQR